MEEVQKSKIYSDVILVLPQALQTDKERERGAFLSRFLRVEEGERERARACGAATLSGVEWMRKRLHAACQLPLTRKGALTH